MSCPGCAIITSLLITLKRKMSFLVSPILQKIFSCFNHILLLGKFYIYSWKCQNGIPSLQGFIARTRRIYNIELHIAKKRKFKIKLQRDKIKLQRDKLNNHFKKWEKLISVFPNK